MYDHLEQKYLIDYGADSENFKMRFQAALDVNQSISETLKFTQISSVYIYIEPHLFFGSLFCSIIHPIRWIEVTDKGLADKGRHFLNLKQKERIFNKIRS